MKEIVINNNTYGYDIINGAFVYIRSYNPGTPLGKDDFKYVIDIPEMIEELPVLGVGRLVLQDNGHFTAAAFRIIINLPEHTTFSGFEKIRGAWGLVTLSYTDVYYKRTQPCLYAVQDRSFFSARKIDDESCMVTRICMSNIYRVDNVWDPVNQTSGHTKLSIPGEIGGLRVVAVGTQSTLDLPTTLTEIYFADSIEKIEDGCFNQMRHLEDVYFGKSLRTIGGDCFNFFEEDRYYRIKRIPDLNVHCSRKPEYPETSFVRYAISEDGDDDNDDWGWVSRGSTKKVYNVNFIVDSSESIAQ